MGCTATPPSEAVARAMGASEVAVFMAGDYSGLTESGLYQSRDTAFSISGGRDYVKDLEAGKAKMASYRARYHQVGDEYDPSWDLGGMVQQAQFTLNLGRMVGNAAKMPAWKAGDAFGKARAAK